MKSKDRSLRLPKIEVYKDIGKAIKETFSNLPYLVIAIVTTFAVLTAYYATLISATPWEIFIDSNTSLYVAGQISTSIINALLLGVVLGLMIYVVEKKKEFGSNLTYVQAFASLLFSLAATGCTICGAVLLPTLGIAGSLAALPWAGLEIKILTVFLLIYSISEYAKIIVGKCKVTFSKAVQVIEDKEGYTVEFSLDLVRYLKPLFISGLFFLLLLWIGGNPELWSADFSRSESPTATATGESQGGDFVDQINPIDGVALGITYGDIGPKTVASGALDLEAFKELYEQSGQPLTELQLEVLTKGSEEEIVITRENSYFLLNFFWAFGLANENALLTEGDIAQYGEGQVGSFASTGGWTLASKELDEYYSGTRIVNLTKTQQELVEEVSSNIYRPCCGNPTSFPDCNHGMALLGMLELMAAQGLSEAEMYENSKYVNAFWFPSTYNDLAMYFSATEGLEFSEIDAKTILGQGFSSGSGYIDKKTWLQEEGLLPEPPQSSGGGCGV